MPDNSQAFKARRFCWHKGSPLGECPCSQYLRSPRSSYSRSPSREANSREQEEALPQGAHEFARCPTGKQQPGLPKPPSVGLCMTPRCPQPSLPSCLARRLLGHTSPSVTPLPGIPSTPVHSSFQKKTSPLPLPPHWKEDAVPCPRVCGPHAAPCLCQTQAHPAFTSSSSWELLRV